MLKENLEAIPEVLPKAKFEASPKQCLKQRLKEHYVKRYWLRDEVKINTLRNFGTLEKKISRVLGHFRRPQG